jgi:signal transduction histidine kinase
MLEYEFSGLKEKMLADTLIGSMLSDTLDDQRVSDHLRASYFHDFWKQYEILITPCHKEEMLSIQPEGYLIVCDIYFEGLIAKFGRPTRDSSLFFLDNKAGGFNYLSYFDLPDVSGESYRIYVEFYSKLTDETGLGYPDLLIDKETKMTSELRDYSYARYYQGNLVYKYGEFQYSTAFKPIPGHSTGYFYNDGDYDHYVDAGDPENILVISRKGLSFLDLIAPFSYLFLFFGLFLLFFTLAVMLPGGFNTITALNFRNRLQGAIIFLIILSFISIGFITRSYIIRLNNNKNIDNLNEKTFSVLVELEHKLGDQTGINQDMEEYIGGLLYKFSLVFFSDINLYDVSGNLVASSRPQIFDAELISRKMEPVAFSKLAYENYLLFIQQEKIGQQEYLSAYIPFQNNEDKVVAYLNLPYFAKQTEMRREIADFLAAFINAYVLIIVLAVLLTILVSRYITKPLQLIREKMGKIVYGKANEKIEWTREDEIGSLVAEYNRMLDELTSSAERLARSERESAWREMAMQVAHEIKNPLTPMKLSVQHLQRAWDDKSPEFNERLTKFTQTIVEQIESLSEIATAFSDFARMPSGKPEIIELGSVASSAMELFHDQVNVRFEADLSHGPYPLYADPKQVLRIFNNLIRNAVEAVGKMPDGLVSISIKSEGDHYVLTITDNGSGMTESQAAKIFTPSFTTKTSGMGLGLAMVRSIVSEIGGTIRFTTVHGRGTTFIITLPRPERS